MGRHELREHIFELLFGVEFHSPDELETQAGLYFECIGDIDEADRAYISSKYERITALLPELDSEIEKSSRSWKLERIGKTDLAILRLAVYEMKYDDDIPVGVAANEAVELAKEYGGSDSASFVNGIIGTVSRRLSEE